ncbi:MAG TPA: hypothetical protein VJ810_38325 [Blastocatellia bacterium]|nr:hypothetical protein [Blastocatellia bacterium]
MNIEEQNKRTAEAEGESLDEQIYQALVERGWVFPQTIKEVEIAEERMDQEAAPFHTGLPTAEDILKGRAFANSGALSAGQRRRKQPLLALLRQCAVMKATAIAESLEVTVTFLSDISSHSNVIPLGPRRELARLAKANLPGITEQEVLDSFDHSSSQPMAAFRDRPFEEETIDYEMIVRRSDMSEERQRYWLSLADESG